MRRRTADEKARGWNSYRTWQRPADSLLELGTAVRQPAFAGTISTPASALSAHQTPSAPCIPSSAHVAFPVCDPHAPRLKPEVLKDSPAAIPPCPLTHSGIFQTAFFFFFLHTQNLSSLFSFQRPCPSGHRYNLLSPPLLELF